MDEFITSVGTLSESINRTLSRAKELRSSSSESFFANDFGILKNAITDYADCYESLGIKTKQEFDKTVGRFYQSNDVQDAMERLEITEQQWAEFLDENDQMMNVGIQDNSRSFLKVGESLETGFELTDARTGKWVNIFNLISLNLFYLLKDIESL